jgi:thioredoxin 1
MLAGMAALPVVTSETFEKEVVATSEERPVLVDFWGPRCGPCVKMMPWVEQYAEERADSLAVVKVNAEENRRLTVKSRVMGLPTFVLYRDGQEVARLSGDACSPGSITDMVVQHTGARVPGT